MITLILTLCMIPVSATGVVSSQDTCEDAFLSTHKTMQQCTKAMDRQIVAIKQSSFAPFDWMVSCESIGKEKSK